MSAFLSSQQQIHVILTLLKILKDHGYIKGFSSPKEFLDCGMRAQMKEEGMKQKEGGKKEGRKVAEFMRK